MLYQVSRNGQLYGPYTLQDLQRYIASGHVLPTDLVTPEGTLNWMPVAEFLAGEQRAGFAPPTHGYAAGTTPYAGNAIYPDPPDLPWLLALLIGILTGGLFFLAWDLVIASWAKRIEPGSKALLYYIVALVLVILNAGASYGAFLSALHHHAMHGSSAGGLLGVAAWVMRLVARFNLRSTLEAHFNGPEPLGLRLSGVMTFFFGGLYFQNKLNAVNEIKRALRYNAGAV